jgi:hypothetical protein
MLFAIGLTGAHYQVRDIPELSQAVLSAAGRVIAAIHGQHPRGASGAALGQAKQTARRRGRPLNRNVER